MLVRNTVGAVQVMEMGPVVSVVSYLKKAAVFPSCCCMSQFSEIGLLYIESIFGIFIRVRNLLGFLLEYFFF